VVVHGRPWRRPDSGQDTDVVRVGVGDDRMVDIGRPQAGLSLRLLWPNELSSAAGAAG
jgi:hypothetical protein